MTLRNRSLLRKPVAMIRANDEELPDLEFLVEYYGGGEPADVYREALREFAQMKRHERNSLSPARVDRNAFGALMAA
jgi:hypothetical protein